MRRQALQHSSGQVLQHGSGQATLAFVLLISGIIVEIAIAGSLVTYYLSTTGLGERLSVRALAAASAGVRDAQIKITRDKEIGAKLYDFSIEENIASVDITRNEEGELYVYTITSVGVSKNRQRKLVGVVTVNKTTGVTRLVSVTEEAI